jgi:hypothetical protein
MQEDKLIDYKNQEISFLVNDIRDQNREKALSVVAPIDDALANLGRLGKLPKPAAGSTLDSLIASSTNKPKMVDYSDVKFEDVYRPYSDGTFTPRYEQYSTVNLDQEEVAANMQTSGDVWSKALPKFAGKLLTNTIGQLGGIAYGIGAAVNTGSMQSIYDNSFMDTVNDVNTYMDNKLPTYKTKAEREATGLDYLTNQKTWADDFLNGTAFFGGAILSELALDWATGGAALSTAGARWGAKLAQAENFIGALNKARKLTNPSSKAFATGKLSTNLATNLGKAGELANTIRFTATSAGYESAFEANAYMKESEANYYDSFQQLNGRMPTADEEMSFRRDLKTSADGLFAYNMAIVGSSNLAIMGKWFKVKNPLESPGKWIDSKLFGVGYKKVGEEFVETSASKLQKALGKSYGFAKPMFIEGIWEEGMQSVGQNTGKNWVQSKYDPKYTKNSYDLVDSFSDGLAKTYGTAEGWKEIQMGMIIGLLGGAAGNKVSTGQFNPDYAQARAKNKLIVDTRNAYSGKRVAESMAYANRVQSANESAEAAEASGDFTGYELARQSTALAQLNFAYNLDYMDDAVENTVTSIRNIDNESLMKEHGVDEKGAEDMKAKMIDEYKGTAQSYKKYRDFSEYFVGNKLSKEEKAELKSHDVVALKEALAYELTLGEKADKFSTDILQAIKEKVATTITGQEVADAMTIDHVLTKAGKEAKKEGERKVSQITKLKAKLTSLDEEYKNVQNTFYNSVSEEDKKTLLGKLDKITSQKQETEAQRVELAKEYEALFTASKMKNPFSKSGDNIVITAAKLDVLREQAGSVSNLISEYQKANPQESAQLSKLVEEYGRSLDAFQKYADLSRQITDPKLGLRGKRNFISEIKRDKSPSDITIEFLETLSPRMAQATEQVTQATLEGNERVRKVLEEGEQKKKGATIEKPTAEQKDAKKQAEIQKVNEEYDAKIANPNASSISIENIEDFNNLSKEEKDTLKKELKDRIESLPDDFFFLSHLTASEETLDGILKTGLNTGPAAEGTSNVNTTKDGLYNSIEALIDGKINHRGSTKLIIMGFPNSINTQNLNIKKYFGDIVLEHIMTVSPNDAGIRIPPSFNLATFSNGRMNLVGGSSANSTESLEKERQAKLDAIEKKYAPKSAEDTVKKLRAKEDKELEEAIPNINNYKVDGKVDKNRITNTEDRAKFEEIYDKYDKLISPLLKQSEKVEAKKSIKDTVKDMLKNSPYLLEYYGESSLPQVPTPLEIEEFYELANRAINDPKIDTDLIAFKNPYNYKRFSPTTRPSLSKAEVTRLQELNKKMADWQLLEGVSNKDGISINDMLLQDIAVNQFVEPIINREVSQDELVKTAEKEPKETDSGEGIRNEEVLQVYQNVVLKRNKKGTTISHLTLPGLLSRMDISDTISYVETKIVKNKEEAVLGTAKDLDITEVEANVKPGANFVVTFPNGDTATIYIEKSGSLSIRKEADLNKILEAADINYVENSLTKDSGFSPVYDNKTGAIIPTDFKDSSQYSPAELYNMIPGDTVTFSVNLTDEYNQKIIQDYLDGMESFLLSGGIVETDGVINEAVVQLEKDLSDQLKINVLDIKGRKLGDLKANYNTKDSPEFLLLREEALNIVKNAGDTAVTDIDLQLSKESFIKHIFLGMPNFVFEQGAIKYFDINPAAVVDYGYVQNGKIVLKNNTKRVREDYVKDLLNKEGLPIVVFKQGKYLVAFPIQLKSTEAKLGDTAIDELVNAKNLGFGALQFNNILANNGLSPANYNLYYTSADTQSLFSANGEMSDSLTKAIDDLNKIRQTADISTWMLPEHTKENLATEASVAIDIENNPLSSPKPIIDLNKVIDFKADWYSEAIRTDVIGVEKATEIANKIILGQALTPQEAYFSNYPEIRFQIEEYFKLNPDQQSDADDTKNKPCQ